MRLSLHEIDKLTIFSTGALAQKRLAQGIRLNIPESIALLVFQILQFIRSGKYSVAQLMDVGRTILGTRQVLPGVPEVLEEVQIEGTFPDGTKLVTLHHPISSTDGNLTLALYGSFLPIPDLSLFPTVYVEQGLIPGYVHTQPGDIRINIGRKMIDLKVMNCSDRPIQVGSHYHFIETNPMLCFNRQLSFGKRLNIASGTAVRFEPGEMKTVSLVEIGGRKIIHGGNGLCDDYFSGAAAAAAVITASIYNTTDDSGSGLASTAMIHEVVAKGFLDSVHSEKSFHLLSPSDTLLHHPFQQHHSQQSQLDQQQQAFKRQKVIDTTALAKIRQEIQTADMLAQIVTIYDSSTSANIVTTSSSRSSTSVANSGSMSIEASAGSATTSSSTTNNTTTTNAFTIPRELYNRMYGPTTGDIIRLADTELYIQIEYDCTVYGDECKFGGGKVLREGMGQATGIPTDQQLDTVITNALIVDYTGIYKADIGIKNQLIVGIGKAGNPDCMDGVTANMIVGVNTEVIAGEGLIVTAGAVDSHIHFICPQICTQAVSSGITTLVGGGTGPAAGTCATTCTPSPNSLHMMLLATDKFPLNIAFTGKGNTSDAAGLREIIEAGAAGLKLHEDWGTTPAAIRTCLIIADEEDIQVTIHTDTLNESCCVEGTLEAIGGRTIHTYHSEGAGGGHAPDIITVCSNSNIIPSSTNPTRPLTINTIDEHLDMLMVCHHLDKSIPEDIAFAESRIRMETIAAEDLLQDIGAISIISSDSQAMGRVGEVITRTWQTADKMKKQKGQLPEDAAMTKALLAKSNNTIIYPCPLQCHDPTKLTQPIQIDNYRVKRYIAKYTINPCIAHGFGDKIGSIELNKFADLVCWKPSYFGVKPEMVIKGGHIVYCQMGDANASIPTPEPVIMRPMFGAYSRAASLSSYVFVSQKCIDTGKGASYELQKKLIPVKNCRNIGKKDMKLNDTMPVITVDPETYRVVADGVHFTCAPATTLPLAQRYFMF